MELRLKELSEDAKDAVITLWHAGENDALLEGQDLVEVATDKATFDVASPCNGVLVKILKKEGETVKTDEIIAEINEAAIYGTK